MVGTSVFAQSATNYGRQAVLAQRPAPLYVHEALPGCVLAWGRRTCVSAEGVPSTPLCVAHLPPTSTGRMRVTIHMQCGPKTLHIPTMFMCTYIRMVVQHYFCSTLGGDCVLHGLARHGIYVLYPLGESDTHLLRLGVEKTQSTVNGRETSGSCIQRNMIFQFLNMWLL